MGSGDRVSVSHHFTQDIQRDYYSLLDGSLGPIRLKALSFDASIARM